MRFSTTALLALTSIASLAVASPTSDFKNVVARDDKDATSQLGYATCIVNTCQRASKRALDYDCIKECAKDNDKDDCAKDGDSNGKLNNCLLSASKSQPRGSTVEVAQMKEQAYLAVSAFE
jgi:hypothetical protein